MKIATAKSRILLTLIPVLLTMGMIFFFSAQTGEESGAISGGVTQWLVDLLMPGMDELPLAEQERLFNGIGLVIRKLGHFSEFALLGTFLMLHIHEIAKVKRVSLPWLWAWVTGSFYAVTDEVHQIFVGGRGPAVTDVLIDSLGVIFGVCFLCGILWVRDRTSRRVF